MPKRWLVRRRWLVVLETITYTRIYEQQQLGKCWCVVAGKIFIEKLFFAQNIFICFLYMYENIFPTKKSELWYTYSAPEQESQLCSF